MINLLISGRPILTQSASQVVSPTQLLFTIPANPPFSHLAVFRDPDQVIPPGMFGAVYVKVPGDVVAADGTGGTGGADDFRPLGYISNEKQTAIFKINLKGAPGRSGVGGAMAPGADDAMMDDNGVASSVAPMTPGIASMDPNANAVVMVGISLEPEAQLPALLAKIKAQAQPLPQTPLSLSQSQPMTIPQSTSLSTNASRLSSGPWSTSSFSPFPSQTSISAPGTSTSTPTGAFPPPALHSSANTPTTNTNTATTASTATATIYSPAATKLLAQKIVQNAFNFLASFSSTGKISGEEKVPLRTFQEWWRRFEVKLENDPGFLDRGSGDGSS